MMFLPDFVLFVLGLCAAIADFDGSRCIFDTGIR